MTRRTQIARLTCAIAASALCALGALSAPHSLAAGDYPTGTAKSDPGPIPGNARYVSPSGSNSNAGTRHQPWRTLGKAARSTPRGGTAVLLPGDYGERGKVTSFERPGRRGEPTVFRGDPGSALPVIRGHLRVRASHLHFDRLLLDGPTGEVKTRTTANPGGQDVMLSLYGLRDVTVSNSEIRESLWHAGVYISRARRVVLAGNRIHDNGRRPPTNTDHGVYVATAKGTRIRHNYIYDNADRGIQLYPNAKATTIQDNAIDGNGQGVSFGGKGSLATSKTRVARNTITNSRVRYNVESYYPGAVGTRNVVRYNCIHGAHPDYEGRRGAGIERPTRGFKLRKNKVKNPRYADRQEKDFSLATDSPCRELLGR